MVFSTTHIQTEERENAKVLKVRIGNEGITGKSCISKRTQEFCLHSLATEYRKWPNHLVLKFNRCKYSANIGEILYLPSRTEMENHALATLGRDSSLLIWGRSALPFKGLSMKASALIFRVPLDLGPCWEGLPSTGGWCWTASGGEFEGGEGTGEALGVGCASSNLPSRST